MTLDPENDLDWARECEHWHGRLLIGQHQHYCDELDALPIDETCEAWPCPCLIGQVARLTRERDDLRSLLDAMSLAAQSPSGDELDAARMEAAVAREEHRAALAAVIRERDEARRELRRCYWHAEGQSPGAREDAQISHDVIDAYVAADWRDEAWRGRARRLEGVRVRLEDEGDALRAALALAQADRDAADEALAANIREGDEARRWAALWHREARRLWRSEQALKRELAQRSSRA